MDSSLYKSYLKCLLFLIGLYLITAAILNTTVDPYRYNRASWAQDSTFDQYRDVSSETRLGKAALANYGDWKTAIIGSSRMEIGVNPRHPAFRSGKAVNLAMQAAFLREVVPVIRYTINKNPEIHRLIIGIDTGDFSTNRDLRAVTQFYESPFADYDNSLERRINCLVGWSSVEDSIATIHRSINQRLPERDEFGYWREPKDPRNIRRHTERGLKLVDKAQPEAKWAAPKESDIPQELIEDFRKLLVQLRQSDIEVHLVIPPLHALLMINPDTSSPERIAWEGELYRLRELCVGVNEIEMDSPKIRLWTFMLFNDYTRESLPGSGKMVQRLEYWFDLGHCRPKMGDQMVDVIMGITKAPETGVNLLLTDWKTFRQSWLDAHESYCNSNVDDITWYLDAGGRGSN